MLLFTQFQPRLTDPESGISFDVYYRSLIFNVSDERSLSALSDPSKLNAFFEKFLRHHDILLGAGYLLSASLNFDDHWRRGTSRSIASSIRALLDSGFVASNSKTQQMLAFLEQHELAQKAAGDEKKQKAEISRRRRLRRNHFNQERHRLFLLVAHRDGCLCARCGSVDDLTLDHKFPLSKGGSDEPTNLQILCRRCNSRKGDRLETAP